MMMMMMMMGERGGVKRSVVRDGRAPTGKWTECDALRGGQCASRQDAVWGESPGRVGCVLGTETVHRAKGWK